MFSSCVRVWLAATCLMVLSAPLAAASCDSSALGTSRTIEIDASAGTLIGSMQYRAPLPLKDKEVVLTFDDGPVPGPTELVLAALEKECVKATFFMVGMMAAEYPHLVAAAARAGHTVASHTHSHPYKMRKRDHDKARKDIDTGIVEVEAALPPETALAPFFRYPGFSRTTELDAWLLSRGMAVFSADIVADDWQRISGRAVLRRVLARLERKQRGIILLHDIQPKTAAILPRLLRTLKKRGYSVVHMVPKRGSVRVALHPRGAAE